MRTRGLNSWEPLSQPGHEGCGQCGQGRSSSPGDRDHRGKNAGNDPMVSSSADLKNEGSPYH